LCEGKAKGLKEGGTDRSGIRKGARLGKEIHRQSQYQRELYRIWRGGMHRSVRALSWSGHIQRRFGFYQTTLTFITPKSRNGCEVGITQACVGSSKSEGTPGYLAVIVCRGVVVPHR